MRLARPLLAALTAALTTLAAHAADNTLLVQVGADGRYKVWHTEGKTRLNDEELLDLAASARPEGSDPLQTSAGPARAVSTPNGIVVTVADAAADQTLLLDRDDCGAIKLWHSEGTTRLSDEEITELVLTALPGGGKRFTIGENYARAYTARLGYIILLWKPVARR